MDKINRSDLVEYVAEKTHLSKRDARAAVDCLVDTVTEALMSENEININGFGTFTPVKREDRDGTNPKTHQRIQIKGKKTVTFKLSKQFKDELNK